MIAHKRHPKVVQRTTNRFRILFWATLGILCLATLCLFTHQNTEPEKPTSGNAVYREPSTIPKPSARAVTSVGTNDVPTTTDPKKRPHPAYDKKIHPTLPLKRYIPTVEEVENARLGPDGKPRPMSIYKTPAEQALGVIFTTELGSPPPILPNIPRCTSKEALDEFLSRTFAYDKSAPMVINENRMTMQRVREELENYIDGGGDIGGFIDFYVGELRASHEQWKTAQTMLVDMARAGEDAESLRTFRDDANRLLAEKGIKPLTVPPSVRRAMGEE